MQGPGLVVQSWWPTLLLFLTESLLVLQTSANGAASWGGLFPGCGWLENVENQLSQFFFAIRNVLLLGAMSLARNDKFTLRRQPIGVAFDKSTFHCRWQAWRVGNVPAELRFGVHFVDVLPARSAAPGELE